MSRSEEFHFGAAHMGRMTEYANSTGMGYLNYMSAQESRDKGNISAEGLKHHQRVSSDYVRSARMQNKPASDKSQTFAGKSKLRKRGKGGSVVSGGSPQQEKTWN